MAVTQINGATQVKANSIGSGQVDSTIVVVGGSHAFTGDQSMGNHNLTNVADPVNAQDAANKRYVDTAVQGLDQKQTARAATTAALATNTYSNGTAGVGATITANANGALAAQDGVTLIVNDFLLVKDENSGSSVKNGLYVVTQVGDASHPFILTRHEDMDSSAEFSGALVPVGNEGTLNKNSLWLASWSSSFTVGTTPVSLINLAAANTYTGSNGITVTGTVIAPTYGTSSNTFCQGNDSRLSDARTPVGTALTSTKVWVGNGSNLAAAVNLSGDVTIDNAGVVTVANQVRLSKVVTRETPTGTVNGSNVTFTLAATPVSGTEQVFVNGVLQDSGSGNDYTISSATITFLTGAIPQSGDKVRVSYVSQ